MYVGVFWHLKGEGPENWTGVKGGKIHCEAYTHKYSDTHSHHAGRDEMQINGKIKIFFQLVLLLFSSFSFSILVFFLLLLYNIFPEHTCMNKYTHTYIYIENVSFLCTTTTATKKLYGRMIVFLSENICLPPRVIVLMCISFRLYYPVCCICVWITLVLGSIKVFEEKEVHNIRKIKWKIHNTEK